MAKLPYGGFGGQEHDKDEPWTRLASIAEHLEDGEPLPAFLAQWLARAIRDADHNERKLLVGLGLKKPRGRTAKRGDAWLQIGERIDGYMRRGLSREQAIAAVQRDTTSEDGIELFSRTQMQRFHGQYRDQIAIIEAEAIADSSAI